ncbi:MAG: hypothetical protein ACREEM_17425 [Blastocatellia bacterium]
MVPTASNAVAISSLTVIKRIDPIASDTVSGSYDSENPFRFQGGKVVPNLGDAITPAPGAEIAIYFVVYPAAGAPEKPQLTIEFLQDGATLARAQPELGAPDGQGHIPYIAKLPADNFKPGRYEIRVVVRQGQQAAEEHTFFTIEGAPGK